MFAYTVEQSLRHRLFVLIVALGLVIYGLISLRAMPIDVLPDLTRPMVTLITEAEGLSPEEVESLVTYPIEAAMSGLPGMQRVRSTSGAGLSVVYLEFDWDTDVYIDRQFVVERLGQITNSLPPGLVPFMTPMSSVMGEIMLMAFTSDSTSAMDLRELVDWVIRPRLLTIPGVAQVIPIGGEVRQYRVKPNPSQMMSLDVSLENLSHALHQFGANTGGGFVNQHDREYVIRNVSRTRALDDLRNLIVAERHGVSIALSQIADVEFEPRVKRGDAGYMAEPAVIVSVMKQPGADSTSLVASVKQAMAGISQNFPRDVKFRDIIYDQGDFITASVENVEQVLIEASVVVTIVLFIFLMNARTTIISLTAIPISACAAILVLSFMGQTINTMTLGGLAIAIGELVDDAVVGVENVFRRLRQNALLPNPRPAIRVVAEASMEVRSGILIATIIIVVVLLPLYALSGIEGRMFAPFATAYVMAILASLVTAISVTPVLCYFLLSNSKILEDEDGLVLRFLKRINRHVVGWAIARTRAVAIGALSAVVLVGVTLIWIPRVFMPTMNEGSIVVLAELSPGISLEASNRIGRMVERLIMQVPEVVTVGRRTGRAELDEHAEGINVSEVNVRQRRADRTDEEIRQDIRQRLSSLPVRVLLDEPLSHRIDHMISGVRAKIALKIFGDDLDTLRSLAGSFEQKLKTVPGIGDVAVATQARIPQIEIAVDYDRAASYGVAPSSITEALQSLTMGETVSEILDGERRFDLVIRMHDADRTTEGLAGLLVETPRGRIPLSTFAEVRETDGPNNVQRENTRRRIVVRANADSSDMSRVVEEIRKIVAETQMPPGYFTDLDGTFRAQEEASRSIMVLAAISLAMIFVVLYSRYRHVSLTLMIMAIVPMAMIGGVGALWIVGLPLSIASLFGFVTLAGITARNGILKISHYINLVLHEGETFGDKLLLRGSEERLAPVLMTTLAAGLALIPLLFGGDDPGKEILHPIAVVIFGGLISTLTLDTLLTPVLFKMFGKSALINLTEDNAGRVGLKEAY
ncbi:heavy metal efflux pump CzcA [alpha proteobacterium BAL199]|nr:heavy metal efflux pump CzcA [alpha proteobacterium BAL199]